MHNTMDSKCYLTAVIYFAVIKMITASWEPLFIVTGFIWSYLTSWGLILTEHRYSCFIAEVE